MTRQHTQRVGVGPLLVKNKLPISLLHVDVGRSKTLDMETNCEIFAQSTESIQWWQ